MSGGFVNAWDRLGRAVTIPEAWVGTGLAAGFTFTEPAVVTQDCCGANDLDDDMVVETTTATDVASIDDPADTAGEE